MNHDAINDVRRKINEVMKKNDERIVVGWRPELEEKHQEGDVWEARDGTKWTMKNGIKQKVTKLDAAKTPWWCPKCSKALNHRLDVKFWRIRGHCFDCNIKEEMEIRKQGKWEEYEQSLMRANFIAEMKDTLQRLEHIKENLSAPEVMHFDDHEKKVLMVEKWDVDLNKIRSDLEQDITILKKSIEKAEAGDFTDEDIK
jgi:hypothetical protein